MYKKMEITIKSWNVNERKKTTRERRRIEEGCDAFQDIGFLLFDVLMEENDNPLFILAHAIDKYDDDRKLTKEEKEFIQAAKDYIEHRNQVFMDLMRSIKGKE